MGTFYVYITDLFGGELNYCHMDRFIVTAKSEQGALCKIAKHTGLNFRKYYDDVYHSVSGLTGLVFDDAEEYTQYENATSL